jgi:hypothetical protein
MIDRLLRLTPLAIVPFLLACAPFPDVPGPEGAPGDYPALLPIDDLLDQAGVDSPAD